MNRDQFLERVIGEFGLPEDASSGLLLIEQAGFDSLRLMELVTFTEEEAGITSSNTPEEYPLLETLGDTLDYFDELIAALGFVEEETRSIDG